MRALDVINFIQDNVPENCALHKWTAGALHDALVDASEQNAIGYIVSPENNTLLAVVWGMPFKKDRVFHVTGVVAEAGVRGNPNLFRRLFKMLRTQFPGYKLEFNRRGRFVQLDKKKTNKLIRRLTYGG